MNKLFLFILLIPANFFCQNPFDEEAPKWDHKPVKYESIIIPNEFTSNDVIAINDKAIFDFTDYTIKTLTRTVLLKINNETGLKNFSAVTLPESFDVAENSELKQQGRLSKIKIPFIKSYHLNYFLARIIKPKGKIINLKTDAYYATVRWIKPTGEYVDDYVISFPFKDLSVGDVLEYCYQVEYKPNYGSNMLYLSSQWPKVNVEYDFRYLVLPQNKDYQFILTSNIPDSCLTKEHEIKNDQVTYINEKIKLKNVQRVNYFIHALSALQLPQVYFNMNYATKLVNNKIYSIANLPDFKWANMQHKNNTNWHIKFPDDIKKFVGSLPVFENDTNNFKFMKALSDTLNSFKYYSANYMFYNDPRLYSLYSTDHLFKRRISEMNMINIYEGILDEKKVFYYITNVQDKRLGEHNPLIRNRAYENIILAIPTKKTYSYLVPRYNGLNYFLNELPFYYEGAVAALFPVNFEKNKNKNIGSNFKFIKTYCGTASENIRIENSTIKINTDSMTCHLNIKESLSGQFSTILRPLYLKEVIDSTIDPVYFKKCIDKPYALKRDVKLDSKSEDYPFKFIFNCTENIPLKKAGEIDLTNWFSFVLNKTVIFEKPTHDFYFDFPFTDSYNFILEFDQKIELLNTNEFNKTLTNDYFDITSFITKQEDAWLFTVLIQVKQKMLPKENAEKLIEFVDELENINKLKLLYTK